MSGERSGLLDRGDGVRLAWRLVEGEGPTVVWLGGFMSDMAGTKAQALADWAAEEGHRYLRFDYSWHGESEGAFRDQTVTRWRADSLRVIEEKTEGPLVLVAPAPDFTEKLMKPEFPPQAHEALRDDGVWFRPSEYGDP